MKHGYAKQILIGMLTWLLTTMAWSGSCGNITAEEALKAEDMRYAAQTSNDFAALERMFSPDLIYVHSSAIVDNKQSYIDSMRTGTVIYKTMRQSDVVVRTAGCLAILTGNGNYDVQVNGKDMNVQLRFHSIWQKKDGAMQYLSWQSTRIP